MVIVNGFWCMFCETEVTEVSFVETPGVAMGVKTVTVPVFETDENGVADCFAVLVAYSVCTAGSHRGDIPWKNIKKH